jgi:hypothetical protein
MKASCRPQPSLKQLKTGKASRSAAPRKLHLTEGGRSGTWDEEFAAWEVFDEVDSKIKSMRKNFSYFN